MKPRSSALFHFTKSENTLFKILEGGFWPRYCLEDVEWQGLDDLDFVAFPMVCFCDIPLSRIADHVGFYGDWGLGLSKEWAEKNRLNPLMYLSSGSELHDAFSQTMQYIAENAEDEKAPIDNFRYMLAHTKPTKGRMLLGGEHLYKEFYQESEWRYVPTSEKISSYLRRSAHEDEARLKTENSKTKKHATLKFSPNDVKYVFVPKDSDIPSVINFMQTKLDGHPASDLKVLFSRVISLESIKGD